MVVIMHFYKICLSIFIKSITEFDQINLWLLPQIKCIPQITLEHITENRLKDLKTIFKEDFLSSFLNNYEEYPNKNIYIINIRRFQRTLS